MKVNGLFCMFIIITTILFESLFYGCIYFIVDIDQILTKVPIMKDVLALLMPIKDKWYLIRVSFEVETGDLDSLKISNNSTGVNLSILINKWLEKKSIEATWEALLEEVEGPIVNNRQIGDDIRTFLKKPEVFTKYVNL